MIDDNVTRFPISHDQRQRNRYGKRGVPCLVTDRWLRFPEKSDWVSDGHYMFIDVMKLSEEGRSKKLCSVCVSKEDLIRAIDNVD